MHARAPGRTYAALAMAGGLLLTGGASAQAQPAPPAATAAPAPAAGPAPAGAPAPAGSGDVNALVVQTAAALSDGTRRLEQGQAHLAGVQDREAQARAGLDDATARAAAVRTRLAELVSAQYRSAQPSTAVLVLTDGPAPLGDVLHGLVNLEQVRGNSEDALAEIEARHVDAQRLAAESDALTADAGRERDALAAEVAGLQRQAQDAQDRLSAISGARTAGGRASRDRAPEPAPPPPVATTAVAGAAATTSCGGGNLTGYANGMLPTSALCPLDGTAGLVLRADAAVAFNRMAAAGGMPCAGSSYRSYAEQVAVYRTKPSLAAVPGTSNHGWGVAVDYACNADHFGTPAYEWLVANGPTYGWTHPAWAEPGGSRPEPWHWEYTGALQPTS